MNSTVKKAWGYRHIVLVVVWALYCINYLDRVSVLTFLPLIQKDLGLTAVQIGWLGSIFFFGYSLAQFSAGFLADKMGPKKTMNIAIWVFTCVTFFTGIVKTFWQFMFLRVALALGEGHHYTPAVREIANWFPKKEAGQANGFFATAWSVAPAITPILVTWLSASFFGGAWRPIFYILAVPGLLGVFLLWKYVSDSPLEMHKQGKVSKEEYETITSSMGVEATVSGVSYKPAIFAKDHEFYLYCIAWFMQLMIYWGMTTWISTFLVKQHHLDIKTMGIYASMPYIVAFFAMMLGGRVADKVFQGRPRIVSLISYIGCIPVLYLLGQVQAGQTGLLLLMLGLGGFFINFNWGVVQAFPSLRYPKEVVGRAMGIANGIGQFGSFVSPMIAGYLVKTLPDGAYDFSNVFIFWSIAAVIAAVAFFFLKENQVDASQYEVKVDKAAQTV